MGKLEEQRDLKNGVVAAIKEIVLEGVAQGSLRIEMDDIDVTLSAGSVIAMVVLTPVGPLPGADSTADELAKSMAHKDFSAKVEARLKALPNIELVLVSCWMSNISINDIKVSKTL